MAGSGMAARVLQSATDPMMKQPTTRQWLLPAGIGWFVFFGACATAGPVATPAPDFPRAAARPPTAPGALQRSNTAASTPSAVDGGITIPPADLQLLSAQATNTQSGFQQGDWDVLLSGSGGSSHNWSGGNASLAASVGYLFTDSLELSLRQSLSMSDSHGTENTRSGSTEIAFDAHIGTGPVLPFLGVNFGRVYGEGVDDTWTAGPEGGVKWFLKQDAYLLAMVDYVIRFDSSHDLDDGWHEGDFVYTIGFGLTF